MSMDMSVHILVPMSTLMSILDSSCRCYAGGIDLAYPREKLVAAMREHVARGFKAVKMKVGDSIDRPRYIMSDVGRSYARQQRAPSRSL